MLSWTRFYLSPPSISGRYGVLILNAILSLLPSSWGFSFAPGHGVSFFGGIQHSSVNGCSAMSRNFGVLAEDEHLSFYSTISVTQHSCLENTMNSMKGKTIWYWKTNSPGLSVPNMLLEKNGEIAPERMKRRRQSKKKKQNKTPSCECDGWWK